MTAQPIRTVDQLVDSYLDLADKIAQLTEQQAGVKAQLRDLASATTPPRTASSSRSPRRAVASTSTSRG